MSPSHQILVTEAIERALAVLKSKGFSFRPMNRTRPVSKNSGYVEGHTSLQSKAIVIDIYTARLRKPKKISAILGVLAHEVAHHQKKPYRQRYRGRIITRWHYPEFYEQVNKNLKKIKKDEILSQYFD